MLFCSCFRMNRILIGGRAAGRRLESTNGWNFLIPRPLNPVLSRSGPDGLLPWSRLTQTQTTERTSSDKLGSMTDLRPDQTNDFLQGGKQAKIIFPAHIDIPLLHHRDNDDQTLLLSITLCKSNHAFIVYWESYFMDHSFIPPWAHSDHFPLCHHHLIDPEVLSPISGVGVSYSFEKPTWIKEALRCI